MNILSNLQYLRFGSLAGNSEQPLQDYNKTERYDDTSLHTPEAVSDLNDKINSIRGVVVR